MAIHFDMQEALSHGLTGMGIMGATIDGRRVDANETAIYSEKMKYIFTKTYDVVYPEIKGRSIVPLSAESVPNWADTFLYHQKDRVGSAGWVHNYASDFKGVEVLQRDFTGKVKPLGVSYQYSVQDLRVAAATNTDLASAKAFAAREAFERFLDQAIAIGDTDVGIGGFLKDATGTDVGTSVTAITKAAGGTKWQNSDGTLNATPKEILTDIRNLFRQVKTDTKYLESADTLLLGTMNYSVLENTDYSYVDGTTTIFAGKTLLQYVLANVPGLKSIEQWNRLDTVGASGKERVVAYKKDNSVADLQLPQDFEQFPPAQVGLAFKINCHGRFGGVTVRKPKAIVFMDGTRP